MERASRILNSPKIKNKILSLEDVVRAVWPSAVGKIIAGHTSRLRVVRSTLVVEVADAVWQKQLFTLGFQILDRIHKTTGDATLTDIEFRVGIQRREPARESEARPALHPATDEADQILDPVLKKVYRLSRKKATA